MAWQLPTDPDPHAILESAAQDTRHGSYADALSKFLWFHHNALEYCDSLAGMRLSFALGDWWQLAEIYPPARQALIEIRDETEAAFRRNPTSDDFDDLAAINGLCLNEGARTVELFISAASECPALGRELYFAAEPYLIEAGRFDACDPFMNPEARFGMAVEQLQDSIAWNREDKQRRLGKVKNEADIPIPRHARQRFEAEVPILVGLLVQNGHTELAAQIQREALALVDNPIFRALMDAALLGTIPEPAHVALARIRRNQKERLQAELRINNSSPA